MFHHIKKISSTIKASPLEILHQLRTQVNLYPKNNNKVVRVMDQSRFLDEEEPSKKPAAAGTTLLDQVSLRPFELTDVDDIMLWATDDQLSRYNGWKIYTSKEDAIEYIENYIIPHPWYRAICLKNQPIGNIFVDSCYGGIPCFGGELCYAVASKHWGKGIATTAVKMVLDTVFKDQPHLERLVARVNVKNLGSLRVLEKAGFRKIGVHRAGYTHKGRTIDNATFRFVSFKRSQLD